MSDEAKTIAELEAILNSEDNRPVTINPDGTITVQRDELKAQLANQHDENCDTRDTMMPGKPCNCYVMLKSKLEDAIAGGTAAAELLVEAHEQIDELKAQLADAEKRGMERALEFFKPYQHAVSDAIAGRIRAEMEKKP